MLKKELLEILVCPQCKGELEYQVEPEDDRNGRLICHRCQLVYRVEDDIPIMLVDKAEKLSSS